jgi:hypothetical protein
MVLKLDEGEGGGYESSSFCWENTASHEAERFQEQVEPLDHEYRTFSNLMLSFWASKTRLALSGVSRTSM